MPMDRRSGRRSRALRRWLYVAHCCRSAARGLAILFVLLMATLSVAEARNRIAPPRNVPQPHIVFFTDYFLVSAQQNVMAMTNPEQLALAALLDACPDTLMASEILNLRCDLGAYRYFAGYRQDRQIDHLLDAMHFMTGQFRYNQMIGRESQAGIEGRLRYHTRRPQKRTRFRGRARRKQLSGSWPRDGACINARRAP